MLADHRENENYGDPETNGEKQEPFSAVSSSHREAQPQAGDSMEDIDVIHDSTNMSDSESVPNLSSLAGQRSDPVNVRKETVIKMPPARRIEADGKTYAELVTVQSVNEETNKTNELREPTGTPTTITGGGPGAVALNCENMRYGGPPWNGVQATAHFPGEYVIAAVAQRDMYSGELMSLPFPIKLYSPYPNGYRYPTILLNVPPPPPPVPGSFHDPHLGLPNFHSSALPYSPEARPAQECPGPFLPPLSAFPQSLQGELPPRHAPHPSVYKHREQVGDDQFHGSRLSNRGEGPLTANAVQTL